MAVPPTAPIPPTPPTPHGIEQFSKAIYEFFEGIGKKISEIFNEIRFFFAPDKILSPDLKNRVKEIKLADYNTTDPKTETENQGFIEAFSGFCKKLVGDTKKFEEVQTFLTNVQSLVRQMYQEEGIKQEQQLEHLPTLLSSLLSTANPRETDLYAAVCPFTPGGMVELDQNDDKEIIKRIHQAEGKAELGSERQPNALSKMTTGLFTLFGSRNTSPTGSDSESEEHRTPTSTKVYVTLAQLKSSFDDIEGFRADLKDRFEKQIQTPEGIREAEKLLSVINPQEDALIQANDQQTIFEALVETLLPKVLEKCLAEMKGSERPKELFNEALVTIDTHLKFINKWEARIEGISNLIDETRHILLTKTERLTDGDQIRLIENVWNLDPDTFFALSLTDRANLLNQPLYKQREGNYLKEARYQGLESNLLPEQPPLYHHPALEQPDNLSWARNAIKRGEIPDERQEELEEICKKVWETPLEELQAMDPFDRDFIFRKAAYESYLKKKMADQVSSLITNYFSKQITPGLVLEVLNEIKSGSDENRIAWEKLETSFPLLKDLQLQLEKAAAGDPDPGADFPLDFTSFIKDGLPLLIQGGSEWILHQEVVSNFMKVEGVEKLMDETVLPTSIATLHGIIIDTLLQQRVQDIGDLILQDGEPFDLIREVKREYLDIVQREGLEIPEGVDIDLTLAQTFQKIKERLTSLLPEIQAKPREEQSLAMREVLKIFFGRNPHQSTVLVPPNLRHPDDVVDLYPELAFTIAFDVGEWKIPHAILNLFKSSPLFPVVGSNLTRIVTSSLYPYGHRETVRKMTELFTTLTQEPEGMTSLRIRVPLTDSASLNTDSLEYSLNSALAEKGIGNEGTVEVEDGELIVNFNITTKWAEENKKTSLQECFRQLGLHSVATKISEVDLKVPLEQKTPIELVPFEIRIPLGEDQVLPVLPFAEARRLRTTLGINHEIGRSDSSSVTLVNRELVLKFQANRAWIDQHGKVPLSEVLTQLGLEKGTTDKLLPEALATPLREKLLREKVKKLAKVALSFAKANLGIKEPNSLPSWIFSKVIPESEVEKGINTIMKKALFREALYHHRLLEQLAIRFRRRT